MAYLGQGAEGNFTTTNAKDTFSGNGSTTTFTLSQRGTENNVDVFVNNVRQEPGVAYNIEGNGTSLVFTAAPSSGTNNIYVVNRGPAELSATHPSGQALEAYSGTFSTDLTVGSNLSADGTIIDLQKDGTTVGSIGVDYSSRLYIGTGDTGLFFNDLSDAVQPISPAGDLRGNAIDLGTAGTTFKDLYLGGGVYVGGTGSANHLDDYEEGTWTPTLRNGPAIQTIYSARYVKVGNLCTATLFINIAGNTDGDNIEPTLPFTAADISSGYWAGSIGYNTSGNDDQTVLVTPDTNVFTIRVAGTGATRNYNQYSGNTFIATVTYQTA